MRPLGLDYFHAFEDDLGSLSRFIEFAPDNYSTYSLELVRLLLAAGSEVEVALRELCKLSQPTAKPTKNIDQHKKILLSDKCLSGIPTQTIAIRRFDIELTPWKDWGTRNPDWWAAYNAVKHDRAANYRMGNLGNALNAVAALGIVMQYVAGPTNLFVDSSMNFRGYFFSGLRLTGRMKQ